MDPSRTADQRARVVGPVLRRGLAADAVIAAICELNENVSILDRGTYMRVAVPERCIVTRSAIEAHFGRIFRLPGDLEMLMPSFAGSLAVSDEGVVWM